MFYVSLNIGEGKSQLVAINHNIREEEEEREKKGKLTRNGREPDVILLTSLAPYRCDKLAL